MRGQRSNDAVGELLGLLNGYNYANGNPVNLTDPSGLSAQPTQWWNPVDVNCFYSAVGLAQRFSQGNSQAYNAWFDVLIQKDWGELKGIEALGSATDVTGGAQQFLDNALIIPDLFVQNPQLLLQALNQYLFGCGSSNVAIGSVTTFGRSPQGLFILAGGIAIAGVILGGYAALRYLTQSSSGAITQPFEFRLTGFDLKVRTLAEHLAKLLERDVAGYPPSDPNPNRDPDGLWCRTIRRVIQEIDGAGYTNTV